MHQKSNEQRNAELFLYQIKKRINLIITVSGVIEQLITIVEKYGLIRNDLEISDNDGYFLLLALNEPYNGKESYEDIMRSLKRDTYIIDDQLAFMQGPLNQRQLGQVLAPVRDFLKKLSTKMEPFFEVCKFYEKEPDTNNSVFLSKLITCVLKINVLIQESLSAFSAWQVCADTEDLNR